MRARTFLQSIIPEASWCPETEESDFIIPSGQSTGENLLTPKGNQAPCTNTIWDEVDDPVGAPDDDATYAERCGTGGFTQRTNVDMENPDDATLLTGAEILKLKLHGRARNPGAQAGNYMMGIYKDTAHYMINNIISSGAGWANFVEEWPSRPWDSQPWTLADINALQMIVGILSNYYPTVIVTQQYAEIVFNATLSLADIVGGRVWIRRNVPGATDHYATCALASSEDWTGYDYLRFRVEKITYAGANPMEVGLYNGANFYSVPVGDYCQFDNSTGKLVARIPLADFVALGLDITAVTKVGFLIDGDAGDYSFYIDDMVAIKLDGEFNEEYTYTDIDVQGFAQVSTGMQVRNENGEFTERGAIFYLPKTTTIDKKDHIIYNSEEYVVIGVNDSFPTHKTADTYLMEVQT